MLIEITDDTLEGAIQSHDKVLVQYSAGWCGNCRIMKPKFKKLSVEHKDVQFILIDAEKNPQSRQLANVDNLPTFAAFHKGELKNQEQTNKADVLKSMVDAFANY